MSLLAQKLEASHKTLFSPSELTALFAEIRREWLLPRKLTDIEFRDLALETKTLEEVHLRPSCPLHTARYHRGNFSGYELALSLRAESYLSHATAEHGCAGWLKKHPQSPGRAKFQRKGSATALLQREYLKTYRNDGNGAWGFEARSLGSRIPTRRRRPLCVAGGRDALFRQSRGRFRGRIGLRRSVRAPKKPLPGCGLFCRCART